MEICKNLVCCTRKECGHSTEVCRNFTEILWICFYNDPFPNDPISELLRITEVVFTIALISLGFQNPAEFPPDLLPRSCLQKDKRNSPTSFSGVCKDKNMLGSDDSIIVAVGVVAQKCYKT